LAKYRRLCEPVTYVESHVGTVNRKHCREGRISRRKFLYSEYCLTVALLRIPIVDMVCHLTIFVVSPLKRLCRPISPG
jgi:hypothetical protein